MDKIIEWAQQTIGFTFRLDESDGQTSREDLEEANKQVNVILNRIREECYAEFGDAPITTVMFVRRVIEYSFLNLPQLPQR